MILRCRIMELLDGRPKTWLSRKLKVTPNTVTNWVNGDTMMPYDKAREAALLFGVPMEELYEEVEETEG